jgi:hypothetical protein
VSNSGGKIKGINNDVHLSSGGFAMAVSRVPVKDSIEIIGDDLMQSLQCIVAEKPDLQDALGELPHKGEGAHKIISFLPGIIEMKNYDLNDLDQGALEDILYTAIEIAQEQDESAAPYSNAWQRSDDELMRGYSDNTLDNE